MATDRIAEIRARLEAATTGPWEWTGGYPQRITNGEALLIAEVYHDPDSIPHETIFIAYAPDDIRYLLDEVERFRRDRLENEMGAPAEQPPDNPTWEQMFKRLQAAQAEVEQLRGDTLCPDCGIPNMWCKLVSSNPAHCWRWDDEARQAVEAEVERLRKALDAIIEEFRSGDGGYDEDDPVVILARAALHPDSGEPGPSNRKEYDIGTSE